MNNSTISSDPKQERLELLAAMQEMNRRKQANPLKYAVQHAKQKEATTSDKPIRALFWGNRVGKTEWGAQEVVKYVLGEHPTKKITPPIEVWCACPSYDQQKETVQKKLERYLPSGSYHPPSLVKAGCWGELRMKNGSRINFKSYEQGREKFQGVGKRLIWFDEEPPYDIWEECFVRHEAGIPLDIILTMTPVKGMTWVYDKIYLDTQNHDLFISTAGWDDNPWLSEEAKEQMSRGLSPESIQVRKLGQFVKRVGLVCAWWNRDIHLRHYDYLDPSWGYYEVLDGGFSDPSAWLLLGIDNDNSVHVVNGFRRKQLTAQGIKEMRDARLAGKMIISGWIDCDDPRLQEDLSSMGMYLQPISKLPNESKSWDETLAMKLEEYGQIQPGTGKPRLYISDSLIEYDPTSQREINWLVQEIENLVWLEKSSKDGFEVQAKWDAHRRFGHHFDGLYALSYFLISYNSNTEQDEENIRILEEDSRKFREGLW